MKDQTLSDREMEILRLITTGISNKEISKDLNISINTVKVHLRNIFEKLDVNSRTEAAMWAVQNDLVNISNAVTGINTLENNVDKEISIGKERNAIQLRFQVGVIIIVVMVFVVIGYFISQMIISSTRDEITEALPYQLEFEETRWKYLSSMPTARAGQAVGSYNNKIYIIAGENNNGVLDVNEVFDPKTDTWESKQAKPTSVTDAKAGVVGGKIYIPGGMLSNGDVTNVLEIYDPLTNSWTTGKPIPQKMSAYSLVTFEGKLFLLGGWNGNEYLDTIFIYDPSQSEWIQDESMDFAFGYATATVVEGKIYVIGGRNKQMFFSQVVVNSPILGTDSNYPFSSVTSFPEKMNKVNATSIAGNIYVTGMNEEEQVLLAYLPQENQWYFYEIPSPLLSHPRERCAFVSLNSEIYFFGGKSGEAYLDETISFQAIYTVIFPILRPDS